jgi:lipopolysaccharide/colanic/teichoic acid biosynthesis glycosyltransferase
MRRCSDVAVSAAALILLMPVLAAIAMWIAIDSPGNPFYRAWRVGKNGRKFRMWKFRSMTRAGGPGITRRDDARITRSGAILRRTKLDELPQFWNVLMGDMTLVGPRPESPEFVALYTQRQREVLRVKPGVTGPAQLASGDESDWIPEGVRPDRYYIAHMMAPKIEMDLAYLETHTAWSDARVVFETAGMVAGAILRRAAKREPELAAAVTGLNNENLDRDSV